jgi:hypothetical protein
MERTVTVQEAAVVEWLLDHAAMGDVTAYRQKPVEALQVIPGCACGCASLEFAPKAWGGARMIADGLAVYPDGQEAGLILWGREGAIVLLEIFDHHPGSSRRFPEIAHLRTYEERGRELL